MSTHTSHTATFEVYFCTVTCYKWLPLLQITQSYDAVYNWFSHLIQKNCFILGYVIMPNHLHILLFPTDGSINRLVSNGKRFLAYDIVNRLKKSGNVEVLRELRAGVQFNESQKGKKHQVFRLSFDARLCFNERMIEQKLNYIHHNPVSGKWRLVEDFTSYQYSSAGYYELETENKYVSHYKEVVNYK